MCGVARAEVAAPHRSTTGWTTPRGCPLRTPARRPSRSSRRCGRGSTPGRPSQARRPSQSFWTNTRRPLTGRRVVKTRDVMASLRRGLERHRRSAIGSLTLKDCVAEIDRLEALGMRGAAANWRVYVTGFLRWSVGIRLSFRHPRWRLTIAPRQRGRSGFPGGSGHTPARTRSRASGTPSGPLATRLSRRYCSSAF